MKILCIGDSNTYGYDPRSYFGDRYPTEVRWTDRLAGHEVINLGVNGMTIPRVPSAASRGLSAASPGYSAVSPASSRIAGLIRLHDPDLVTVMLGTNDLFSGLSAQQIAGRMEAFLDSIMDAGKPILLISPPVLQYGEWVMDDDIVEESQELGGAYRELAERKDCVFADSGEWDIEMSFDGVHFSQEGHAVFAQKLEEILTGILEI